MAEQIISPGVFTRENDQSFLPQGVGAIGAAIVGPTVKGPAFVPTVVRSFSEYERRFGGLSKETFVPQTVREYLRNAGSVTVTRVLAGGGYEFKEGTNEPVAICATKTTSEVAKFATASFRFNTYPNAINSGNTESTPDILIIDQTKFIFVEVTHVFDNVFQTNDLVNFPLDDEGTNGRVYVDCGDGAGPTSADVSTFVASFNLLRDQYPRPILFTASRSDDEPNNVLNFTSSLTDPNLVNVQFKTGSKTDPVDNTVTPAGGATTFKEVNEGDFLKMASAELGAKKEVSVDGSNLLLGIIYPSKNIATPDLGNTTQQGEGSIIQECNLLLRGNGITDTQIIGSVNPSDNNYIFKQLGDNPNNSKTGVNTYNGTPGYTYMNFKSLQKTLMNRTMAEATDDSLGEYPSFGSNSQFKVVTLGSDMKFEGLTSQTEGYSYASTPFITSQIFEPSSLNGGVKELFKFHSLGHGDECNIDYKISITGLREPADIDGEEQYSTFSILIRRYNDTDKNPVILEQYNNCNLNPESSNYIARVIGDRYPQYNDTLGKVELLGNYPNVSQLCRVEVSNAVASKAVNPKVSPKGFRAVQNTISSQSFNQPISIPSASYEGNQVIGNNYNNRAYLGWKFDEKELDNKNFLKALPSIQEFNVAGDFNIENYNGHSDSGLWTGSLSASIDSTGQTGPTSDQLQFSVCFQGGTDGIAPYQVKFIGNESSLHGNYSNGTNLYGFDLSASDKAGSKGYKKALNILSNQDEYDINMVALPGVIKSLHTNVTNAAVDMVEERGDAFYVMDLTQYDQSINQAVNAASGLDTNYAAVYYPWVKVNGPSGVPTLVPPSVIVPGAIAASDRIAAEWFAPAGLNRGVLGNVIEAKIRLNQSERDRLYNAKINPIATFPQTGVCIWGQKTLQERSTALDRINVRRLLIALKKFIASSSRYLVFEQNTNQTRNRFLNIVNPYLESVQQRQGLYSFRVQMDEANNTADVVDRNQLVGAIYLQPTKTAEFIILDFNVLPTGATFDGNGGGGY